MVALIVALALPTTALAATPPLANWGELVPGFTPGLDTSDANDCTSGRQRCVLSVIRKMGRELTRQARRCDHNAIFQLGYLRTTQAYYESSQIDGFYSDVPWMHHYDAVFAAYYLRPQQDWRTGNVSAVPPAWREAFGAADAQELTSIGNFLMGMNAHINRDLPFVLADIGLTDEAGNSRKPDHEKVNEFLNNVGDDLTPEMTARFDPAWDTNANDDLLTAAAVQQVIQEWRERAWNNAWLMTYGDPVTAALVAQGIEAGSASVARQIRQMFAYGDDADRDARNAHCAQHGLDDSAFDGQFFDDDEMQVVEPDAPDTSGWTLPQPLVNLNWLTMNGVRVTATVDLGVSISVR